MKFGLIIGEALGGWGLIRRGLLHYKKKVKTVMANNSPNIISYIFLIIDSISNSIVFQCVPFQYILSSLSFPVK
jgi:hypothetical protein